MAYPMVVDNFMPYQRPLTFLGRVDPGEYIVSPVFGTRQLPIHLIFKIHFCLLWDYSTFDLGTTLLAQLGGCIGNPSPRNNDQLSFLLKPNFSSIFLLFTSFRRHLHSGLFLSEAFTSLECHNFFSHLPYYPRYFSFSLLLFLFYSLDSNYTTSPQLK